MLSHASMTVVDTLVVGQLGAEPLAGVALGGAFAFAITVFGLGLARGVKLSVSQTHGAGAHALSRELVASGLVLGVIAGAICGLGALGASHVVGHLAGDPTTGEHAATYLAIRGWGGPFFLVTAFVRESRQAYGDARTGLVAAVIANVVNGVLDIVLVRYAHLGVSGAAIASVCGQGMSCLTLLFIASRFGIRFQQARTRSVKRLAFVGMPLAFQGTVEVASFLALVTVIARTTADDLAAHEIVLHVVNVAFFPTIALGDAASVLVGQAIGAGRLRIVWRVARVTAAAGVVMALVSSLVLVFGGRWVLAPFTTSDTVLAIAARLAFIAGLFQIFDAMYAVFRGVLRGTGDVKLPATVSMIASWVITPPLAYALAIMAGWGAEGAWLALYSEMTVLAVFFGWRLWRGGWVPRARAFRAQLLKDAALAAP